MKISACLWGLPESPDRAVEKLAAVGIENFDVDPGFAATLQASTGPVRIRVTCLAAGHLMPPHAQLDSRDPDARIAAMKHIRGGVEEARRLGAEAVYIGPPPAGRGGLRDFEAAVSTLADDAANAGLRFCIEHVPGTLLESAGATTDLVRRVGNPNLYTLIDVGHCLISGEDPALAVADTGDRLGYIHFDDNNRDDDLHLPLTEGVLDMDDVVGILAALVRSSYKGSLSIEGKNNLPDPVGAVAKSLEILTLARAEVAP